VRHYYPDISIKVNIEYAMNIKAELMNDERLIIQQDRATRSATFARYHARYEHEKILIEPADGSRHTQRYTGNSYGSVSRPLMNQIRGASRMEVYEPPYNLTFNMAAFDTVLGALQQYPHPGIQNQIMDALLPCAKAAPYMFFDKLIHKLPPDTQIDYLFRMDEFMPDVDEDSNLLK
jgi:hypothetical protein